MTYISLHLLWKIVVQCFLFFGLEVKLITQGNFDVAVQRGQESTQKWFDAPKFDGYVKKMSISFKWKDQGSGYRKGKIWLQIIRGMEKILETSKSLFGTAPQLWKCKSKLNKKWFCP